MKRALLGLFVLAGLAAAALRYAKGLGAVSNLSDGRAWGLWVSLDLYCGVALAAGGFTLAAIVHLFGRSRYSPLVRPAVLTALLGYLMVILALLVDLGQPWRIWHILIDWNPHSPLFEVGWCVLLYTLVLALEFSPAVFERLRMERAQRWIGRIQIPLITTGVVLSVLHQSSLGSTLLLMPQSIHPLWFTPIMPVLFLLSAFAVGIAMVILESGRRVELVLLEGLGRALPWLLGLSLLVRFADLFAAKKLGLVFASGIYSVFFGLEILGGVIAPMLLVRHGGRRALFGGSLLVVFGVVLNRFDATLVAVAPRTGSSYFPHPLEFAISIGIVSAGLLGYLFAERHLPVRPCRSA